MLLRSGWVKLPEEMTDVCCGRSDSTPPFYTIRIEQKLLFFSGQKAAGLGWKDPGSLGGGDQGGLLMASCVAPSCKTQLGQGQISLARGGGGYGFVQCLVEQPQMG